MKQCSVCKKLYCSRECQKKDWKLHKAECGRQLEYSAANGAGGGGGGAGSDQFPLQVFYPPLEIYQPNEFEEEFGVFDVAETEAEADVEADADADAEDAENGSNGSNVSSE